MKILVHNILNTPYSIKVGSREELHLNEGNIGECRVFSKDILVCTDTEDCNEFEVSVRTGEVLAHEIFHAYSNEAGLVLDDETEEMIATFYMKNWRKMTNSILEVLDKMDFLDK